MLKVASIVAKEKRSELVGALVTRAIKEELAALAEKEERSISFVAGALMERGLQAFRKDGLLRSQSPLKLGVVRAKAEEPPRKKTKV